MSTPSRTASSNAEKLPLLDMSEAPLATRHTHFKRRNLVFQTVRFFSFALTMVKILIKGGH